MGFGVLNGINKGQIGGKIEDKEKAFLADTVAAVLLLHFKPNG